MMIAVRDGCETARKISSQRTNQALRSLPQRVIGLTSEVAAPVDAFRVTEHRMPLKRVKRLTIATI